ncbi:MAG: cell division protein FtsA [Holosporales bacterium]|jgi:cell division protein FtsA|nr:cell division protein FtsA [Holosporales bacterium]
MSGVQQRMYGSFAGLDIGTEKISCAIGGIVYTEDSVAPNIVLSGFGQRAARGINTSGISDLEALEDSVLNAIYTAEENAQKNIKEIYVSIPTSLIQTRIVNTNLSLSGKTIIQDSHIRKLFNVSKSIPLNSDQYIIHVWPLYYTLDDMKNINDPVGMIGKELSAVCHVVMVSKSYIQNITHCIGKCNLDVASFVADQYAAGLACLIDEESELGCTLIDIGGKSTQISCFYSGNLVWFGHIPIGGFHITSDLANMLSVTLSQAERIKTLYGSFIEEDKVFAEMVPITQIGMKNGPNVHYVSRKVIFEIMKARADEILDNITDVLREAFPQVSPMVFQKILLTGGTCHLQGLTDMIEERLNILARLALQTCIDGQDSILQSYSFSTCAGLLRYAAGEYLGSRKTKNDKPKSWWKRLLFSN